MWGKIPCKHPASTLGHCLIGLVVQASVSRMEDPEFKFCLRCGNFCGLSHTSDLEIRTPVATLALGVVESGLPDGSILNLGRKFDLQLPSQCGSMLTGLSRSVLEIH